MPSSNGQQSLRVDREEIDEKAMMTPGDVVMLLNETGGMRVQATSPSLGAASTRFASTSLSGFFAGRGPGAVMLL